MSIRVARLLCACLMVSFICTYGKSPEPNSPLIIADENQRYLCLALLNTTEGAYEGLDVIREGAKMGFNSVMVTIRWDVVYNSPSSPSNWQQYDNQIRLCKELGLKMFFRVHLGRCCERHIGFWTDEEASRDQKGYILHETLNMSNQPAVNKAMSFVREVAQRYLVYQQQGDVLCISTTTTPTQEAGFHYEGNVPPGYRPYLSMFDYAPSTVQGFKNWLKNRYGNITTINSTWRSDYSAIEDIYPVTTDYAHPENRRNIDWYLYRHSLLKNFLDQASTIIKSVNGSYRVVNEFGAVWDDLSLRRATLAMKDLTRNVDGIKVADSIVFPFFYSSDVMRTNLPAGKWVMNEVFKEALSQDQMTRMLNSHYEGGCKLVNVVVPNISTLEWFAPSVKSCVTNWISKPMTPIVPVQKMTVKLSELVIKGGYGVAGVTARWQEKRKSGPVDIRIIEDLLGESETNLSPVLKKVIHSYTLREGFEANYAIDPTSFEDPDGSVEKYEFSGLPTGMTYDNNVLKGTPQGAGSFVVTVKATDEFGASGTSTFKIDVLAQKPPKIDLYKAGNFQTRSLIRTLKTSDSLNTTLLNFDLNFFATPDPAAKAVVFILKGPVSSTTTETEAPFAAFGDNGGKTLLAGTYEMTVETYSSTTPIAATGLSRNVYRFVVTNNRANQPPTLVTGIPNQNAVVGRSYNFSVPQNTFADKDGVIARYTFTGLPTGLEPTANGLSGTPNQVGTYLVTVEAFDNDNGSVKTQFILRVGATNLPPVANEQIPNQTLALLQNFEYLIPNSFFTDPDGSITRIALINLPAGLVYQNGKIMGKPTATGTNRVTVRAFDNLGAWGEMIFSITVTQNTPNRAPQLIGTLSMQRVLLNQTFNWVLPANTFVDPDGDPIAISYVNLPQGLSFFGDVITGTPTVFGDYIVTVRATDIRGAYTDATFVLSITDGNINIPPKVVTPIPDQSAIIGQLFRYEIPMTSFDDVDGFITSLTVGTLPPGLTYSSGIIVGTPTKSGTFTVVIKITDDKKATTEEYFNIKVNTSDGVVFAFSIFKAGGSSSRRFYQTLKNGDKISAEMLPSIINIFAETNVPVDKVMMDLSGAKMANFTDNKAPFGLMGDNDGFRPALGSYMLKATAYRNEQVVGTTALIFEIVNAEGGSGGSFAEDNPVFEPAPNPFQESVEVSVPFDYQSAHTSFAVVTLTGQSMPVEDVQWRNQRAKLNLAPYQLSKGLYLLQIRHPEMPTKSLKVIKQ